MVQRSSIFHLLLCLAVWVSVIPCVQAQAPDEAAATELESQLKALQETVATLKTDDANPYLVADVEVFAKAVEWILRHEEFYKPNYVDMAKAALKTGTERAAMLAKGETPWDASGRFVRGYVSEVDGSVQPYAVSVPEGFDINAGKRWPLQINLHGRGGTLNEVSFIAAHDGKKVDEKQTWIQLDVFGRTNNAYRWAGEADVFEALNAVKKLYRIDQRRIVLRGFSMGGAGSWHLGLHYPSLWCSVGPGAGFIDFYKYQNVTEKLPEYQHKTLGIYDSIDYVRNAYNVPVCTYGGEMDAQLIASTAMVDAAKALGIDMKLIIGKGVGHKFTPEGFEEFMAFHNAHMEKGRRIYPGAQEVHFSTRTLKYNQCEWLTIEETIEPYKESLVEGKVDEKGILRLKTDNVAVLQIARDIASDVELDGDLMELTTAADGLLPGVFYERVGDGWSTKSYDSSLAFNKNYGKRKRKDLQGPIDDAFMRPFLCVRGTGKAWTPEQQAWADWTLARFEAEFDKWMRGKIRIIDDSELTDELVADHNLILFGDPGSNAYLDKILDQLPVEWTNESLTVDGKSYDPKTHGLSLIYPNPLSPRNYIVVNSGHTFHEKDFKASNAWLFPRLGDIAVQNFKKTDNGYDETVIWAEIFDSNWRLGPPLSARESE